jgi:NitT/TauT family transport system permease protein
LNKKEKIVGILAPAVMFLILFILWEVLLGVFNIPRWILPGPIAIFESMVVNFSSFWPHIWVSIVTIFIGFAIAVPIGILLAAIITNFRLVNSALDPYIIFLVVTPLVTLVPLLMFFLGFGINVRIIAVVLTSFAIVNMNAATGFNNVEKIRLELMQSLRANKGQSFIRVIFPSSLPDVFTGIKLCGIFATTACVSVEYVGGNKGLGSQIIKHTQFMGTEKAFACIFYVAIIGICLYSLISFAEKKIIKWSI